MSLINKVLRDLDARSTSRTDEMVMPETVYQGIRPTGRPLRRSRRGPVTGLALLLVIGAGVYAYLVARGGVLPGSEWVLASFNSASPSRQIAVATSAGRKTAEPGPPVSAPGPSPARQPSPIMKPAKAVKPVRATTPARPKRDKPAIKKNSDKRSASASQSRQTVKASVKKEVTPMSPAEKAENAYRQGAVALEQGNRLLAESHLKQALRFDATHNPARELLAGIYLAAGRRPEAQSVLESGLKKTPGHPRLTLLLSRLLLDQGQNRKAIALLEQGMTANPADAELASLTAAVYQRSQQHESAVKAYRKALSLRPGESRWWLGLAISLEAGRKNDEAYEAYQRALRTGLDAKLAQYARQRLEAVKRP